MTIEGPAPTLSAGWYTDGHIYACEQREIFGRDWILIGYGHQVLNPGDYVAEDIAGQPVVVWRSPQGDLRAFINVCPHRAGPIMWDGAGCQANLVCRYHGWAFNPDGSLRNARDFGAEVPASTGLTPVRVEVWRRMVFVTLHDETPPLTEWLGNFPSVCKAYPLEDYEFHSQSVRPMQTNWKAYADNFLEGYHVPTLHPGLAREVTGTSYRVHLHGDRRWNVHLADQRVNEPLAIGVWAWLWPNFSINVFPGGFAVERWLPRGVDRTDLIFEYFFDPSAPGVDEIVKASEEVADEDALVSEVVHRNLCSGRYTSGWLSPRHENGLVAFHELIREVVTSGGPARA